MPAKVRRYSLKGNLYASMPGTRVRRLIVSIERLTASVERLQRTISASETVDEPNNATSSDESGTGRVERPKSFWTRIQILGDEAIALDDKKDLELLQALVGSSSNCIQFDPWRSLPSIDWNYRSQMGWVSESERKLNQGGHFVPDIIRYYSCNAAERCSCEKLLFFGLSQWWWQHGKPSSDNFIRVRGSLDAGPLIGLAGLRLPSYSCASESSPFRADLIAPILVEMLRMPQQSDKTTHELSWKEEGSFWANNATLGNLFDRCYQRKVLQQPAEDDLQTHLLHANYVMNALDLINIWSLMNCRQVRGISSVVELRSLLLSEVWWYSQIDDEMPPPFEKSAFKAFRSFELSLSTIRNVGKLHIEWTPYLDEHLELDIEFLTLKVFWFGFTVKAAPVFHIGCGNIRYLYCHRMNPAFSPLVDELEQTYSLLFRSHKNTYDANILEYGKLPIPQWLRVVYGKEEILSDKVASTMSYFTRMKRPWISDIEFHTEILRVPIPDIQLFEKYKAFGDRLRMLKAYMDSQKPGGIRGLWKDNRDSLAWHTFWAVIFVGSLSLIISFLSLLASISQAMAAF